jgi:hypothetical protein
VKRRALTTALVGLLFVGAAAAEERVRGADLITADASVEAIMPTLASVPFSKEEIDLFLASMESLGAWVETHRGEWNAVDDAANPIAAVLALGVWETTELTGAEFFALTVKLKLGQQIVTGAVAPDRLQAQLDFLKERLAAPDLPEASRTGLKQAIDALDKMMAAIESYPEENRRLYEEHRGRLEAAFARLDSWSE